MPEVMAFRPDALGCRIAKIGATHVPFSLGALRLGSFFDALIAEVSTCHIARATARLRTAGTELGWALQVLTRASDLFLVAPRLYLC
jgi:hypothetical protein